MELSDLLTPEDRRARQTLISLEKQAINLGVEVLAATVLADSRFLVWSGSSKPTQHHYGDHGLITHTAEVIELCQRNNEALGAHIDDRQVFLAALFHDAGKMWDYARTNSPDLPWTGTRHKRMVHHIARSALVWNEACTGVRRNAATNNRLDWLSPDVEQEVLHAILAHHGQRIWGSPVGPATRLAWLLHTCDHLSARNDDCEKWDHFVS